MALAGDVTHFALGLDLLPLLPAGDVSKRDLIDMAHLTMGGKLGEGQYGIVARGTFAFTWPTGRVDNLAVAIKKINAEHLLNPAARAEIIAENDRLAACNSPFITRC